jgi:hypothetical protein
MPTETFRSWLEAMIPRFGTARMFARVIDVEESKLSRWRRYGLVPNVGECRRLALATGTRRSVSP